MVLALFQQSAPAVLNELVAAAASDDTVLLLGASHKLRGISANVGARLLASRCSQLEAAARLGSVPENAGTQIEGISREYEPSKQL